MSADHCPDHLERLELCRDCQGLTITRMSRLPGVTHVHLEDPAGGLLGAAGGPPVVYLGPLEPCPSTQAREEGAARNG